MGGVLHTAGTPLVSLNAQDADTSPSNPLYIPRDLVESITSGLRVAQAQYRIAQSESVGTCQCGLDGCGGHAIVGRI